MSPSMADALPRAPVLLAGGGTGGHVFPALAVGEELDRRGWEVRYVGRSDSLEERLASQRGVPFHGLDAQPLVGRGLLGRVSSVATLARSSLAARRLVRRLGVRVVFGTGGYVCSPAVVGARLAGRKVMLLEPNARAGVANRSLSRIASLAAVAFEETSRDLHCPTVHTGVPVRSEFFAEAPPPAASPRRLLVLGGSQGARQVNRLVPAALALWRPPQGLSVVHQVGARWLEEAKEAWDAADLDGVRVETVPFLEDVASAMAGAHLIISRAGAVTLAETCAVGRPSILVPLALAGAHQAHNAEALEVAGAAEVVSTERATPEVLARLLRRLLGETARLRAMGEAARRLARPDAARVIAERLERLAGGLPGARR